MNNTLFLCFFLLSSAISFAQSYFQQEVNYKIDVRLDDKKHALSADETVEYINNSPDRLDFIYFHLWSNAYKNNNTAFAKQLLENGNVDFFYAKNEQRGYTDRLDFKVNGESVKWYYDSVHADICKLILNKPLQSGEKIIITTPFHVKIPEGIFSRLGHIGQSYQISQWYPKPAVYDKNGWHPMPYLHQGEFYSEFGSFDVSITLPANYVVGATGDLMNEEKETAWMEKKAADTHKMLSEKNTGTVNLKFPPSAPEFKTLRFTQTKIHDFAWFADKRYHVLKGEVKLPHSERKVITWAMFTDEGKKYWKNSIRYMNDAVYYYSLWNGDYPFSQVTAVEGALSAGGGMEYPNVAIIGKTGSELMLEIVLVHEIGHNWFYGILGSNEREHPWMDEGINSFYENRYISAKYPSDRYTVKALNTQGFLMKFGKFDYKSFSELDYLTAVFRNKEQSIGISSEQFTAYSYGAMVYSKSSLVFDYLKAYLGDSVFDRCMQVYFETWKFKHPQPGDLKKIFTDVSGKELEWFFTGLLQTEKHIDYKIVSQKGTKLLLQNKGKINSPFSIFGIKDNKPYFIGWYEGFRDTATITVPQGIMNISSMQYDAYTIDVPRDIPEINRKNNTIRTSGILRKTGALRLRFLAGIAEPDKEQIFFSPVFGWNNYNKGMLGVAFYNNIFPAPQWEYTLMPLYSFETKSWNGAGKLAYSSLSESKHIKGITSSVSFKKYAYSEFPFLMNYRRTVPEILISLKEKKENSTVSKAVSIRSIVVRQEVADYDFIKRQNKIILKKYIINELKYLYTDAMYPFPLKITAGIQQGTDFVKASLESYMSIVYLGQNRGFDIRFFVGKFIYNQTVKSSAQVSRLNNYPFRMSYANGYFAEDYTFEETMPGRSESTGWMSQQFVIVDGGFKVNTPFGVSDNWLIALNLKTSLPGRFPIRLFADFGTSYQTKQLVYDAGINLSLIRGIFEIYFPLALSENIKQYYTSRNLTYKETVRFELNFNMMNPLKIFREEGL